MLQQNELDVRSLCAFKDCTERATVLIAWPMRWPIPGCDTHWNVLKDLMHVGELKLSPRQWLDWLKPRVKPHILPPPERV